MKKLIVIAAVAFMTAACGVVLRSPSAIANEVRIGMSVDEFKKLAGQHAELDALTADYSVYRIEHFAGPEEDRYVASVKLYHFDSKGHLVRVETHDAFDPRFHDPLMFEPLIP